MTYNVLIKKYSITDLFQNSLITSNTNKSTPSQSICFQSKNFKTLPCSFISEKILHQSLFQNSLDTRKTNKSTPSPLFFLYLFKTVTFYENYFQTSPTTKSDLQTALLILIVHIHSLLIQLLIQLASATHQILG